MTSAERQSCSELVSCFRSFPPMHGSPNEAVEKWVSYHDKAWICLFSVYRARLISRMCVYYIYIYIYTHIHTYVHMKSVLGSF